MSLKCGIVGLPNVGKSTLFNLLTKLRAKTANFPFCTITPNIGIALVPDQRLGQIAKITQPNFIVPTHIKFFDIAGLVKGAFQGQGLGKQFIACIREADAILHVVRCFNDNCVIHITGKVEPETDILTINTELTLFDLELCKHTILLETEKHNTSNKCIKLKLFVLKKCLSHLSQGNTLRTLFLHQDEVQTILHVGFLTLKPTIYIANTNENDFYNPNVEKVFTIAKNDKSVAVVVCASLESSFIKNGQDGWFNFDEKININKIKLNEIIFNSFKLLNLKTFFTIKRKELRAWSVPADTTALQAARKVHTDFEKGFIRAQTISFVDFIGCKGEYGAKKAGKLRNEGKQYVVQDGDIINFLFNI